MSKAIEILQALAIGAVFLVALVMTAFVFAGPVCGYDPQGNEVRAAPFMCDWVVGR
jgi:hypothetical protein